MRRAVLLLLSCFLASAAMATPASAAADRAEYAAQVNAICVEGNQELKARLGKLPTSKRPANPDKELTNRQERRQLNGLGKTLTRLLLRLTRHSGRVITRLVAVPPAPGDDVIVTQWLTSLKKGQRLSKRSNKLSVRFFKSFIGFLLAIVDRIEPDGSFDEGKPTKREQRMVHRFVRITNAFEKHSKRILDEVSRSSTLAEQLGARKCGGETDPNAAAARTVQSINRMAQGEAKAARAFVAAD